MLILVKLKSRLNTSVLEEQRTCFKNNREQREEGSLSEGQFTPNRMISDLNRNKFQKSITLVKLKSRLNISVLEK